MSGSIVFDGVWKKFRRGEHHDSLRDLLPSLAARAFRRRTAELSEVEFWAVRDVSFEVRPGEALGIIGHNGAGKSTVLKLLTKILKPTRGRCEVRGRVGALIEVAAGFHPDLTGRENVYLQGAIVGMKRAEITRKFDQIVEFSGVGDFIDTPVKRFSSGMNARLGFAIAANLDPDVLIIDEVLSVGDATFQARCMTRMRELIKRGVPVVFVSHNLPAVLELCTSAILLGHGAELFRGRPADVVQQYRRVTRSPVSQSAATADARIDDVRMLGADGAPTELFRTGGRVTIRIDYDCAKPLERPAFAVDIHNADGIYCAGLSTSIDGRQFDVPAGRGSIDLTIDAMPLLPGAYTVSAGIHRIGGPPYDLRMFAHPFTLTSDCGDRGLISLNHCWRHHVGVDPDRPAAVTELVTS